MTEPTQSLTSNLDIFQEVVSRLATRDALNLSVTARAVYPIARRQAVSTVTLYNSVQLIQFNAYLLYHGLYRDVQNLTIRTGVVKLSYRAYVLPNAGAIFVLADLLRQVSRLRHLRIHCVESTLAINRQLGDALVSHDRLSTLILIEPDRLERELSLTLDFLKAWQFKPRRLHVAAKSDSMPLSYRDLFQSLADARGTGGVETFELKGVETQTQKFMSDFDKSLQVLTLRDLALVNTRGLPMAAFVHLCPNLRTLCIININYSSSDGTAAGDAEDNDAACWPSLDRLSTSFRGLTRWDITCPVYFLQLDLGRFFPEYDSDLVLEAVQATSPVILSFWIEDDVEAQFWENLAVRAPRLKGLGLILHHRHSSKPLIWIEEAVQILAASKLEFMQICMKDDDGDDGISLTDVQRGIEKLMFDKLAYLPFLKYLATGSAKLFGTFHDPPGEWRKRLSWWRVTRSREKCEAKEITVGEGEYASAKMHSPLCDWETI